MFLVISVFVQKYLIKFMLTMLLTLVKNRLPILH